MARHKILVSNPINTSIVKLVDLFEEVLIQSPYEVEFDHEFWTTFIINAWRNPKDFIILVVVDEDELVGVLCGGVYRGHPVANFMKFAMEMFWYTKPSHRGTTGTRLVKLYEEWAEEVGCTHVCMSNLENEYKATLDKFYKKRGYTPLETQYMRKLS